MILSQEAYAASAEYQTFPQLLACEMRNQEVLLGQLVGFILETKLVLGTSLNETDQKCVDLEFEVSVHIQLQATI